MMKKFEKFLFFYSILAITTLFVSFGLTYPKPINFISLTLLSPLIFYFWLKLTGPETTTSEQWSIRFIVALIILSTIGIYTHIIAGRMDTSYIDALKTQLSQAEKKNEELLKNNNTLQNQLNSKMDEELITTSDVKGDSITDLIFETPMPETTSTSHRLTGKVGIATIDVYSTTSTSAPKIGTLNGNLKYPYIEKAQDWYKIVLSGTTTGWVNVSQIQEL